MMSQKQSYINRINANIANLNSLNVDDFIEDAKNKNAVKKQADIDVLNAGYDKQISNAEAIYDRQIKDVDTAYAKEYERNAVQKLINEKIIAEKNANLGLTDSGLNRTQQTAAGLSYTNQKADLDLARQKTIDSLGLSLSEAITTLQNERDSNVRSVENKWDDLSTEQGISAYNNKYEFYNNQINADNAALSNMYQDESSEEKYILQTSGGLLSRDFVGSFTDNNIDVIYNNNGTTTYVDNNSGKKTTLGSDINPFTGTRNKDVENGVFKNGYQPDNINGKKLKVEEDNAISINGQLQKVFKCGKKYYVWDGKYNEYFEVKRIDDGNGKHHWVEK